MFNFADSKKEPRHLEGSLSILVAQELAPLRPRRFTTISELTQPILEFFYYHYYFFLSRQKVYQYTPFLQRVFE